MSNAIQLREVLSALHDNQLALAAAIEELAKWADERGDRAGDLLTFTTSKIGRLK